MIGYGNNAIAAPLLLELIDFDRVTLQAESRPIYDVDSPFRAQHAAVRRDFGSVFERTSHRGMQVFLDTDMLTLTPPLAAYLRRIAPSANPLGIDTTDPAVWAVYRAGLEELFDRMPSVQGLIIRFGEGGSLYNTKDWPYQSEMAVRSAAGLRAMLQGLLPPFEARGKTLIVRSWTVGVGQLGRLHIDTQVYQAVLDEIDSPSLVISTKYPAGDFFSYLPLNPTLGVGHHRRIIELQAKPEFEGFGAFPNFLGEEYARALRVLCTANPHIVGTYVLSQFGGPLRAGPRTLYPLHGFWLWTDANVFVASSLAVHPDADVNQLTRRWANATFGSDPRIVDAVTRMTTRTRKTVLDGFYIRSFAERAVRVRGLELPPLMWIFEWDMLGGWHSLSSLVYRGSRDHVDVAIAEGRAAADVVREARQELRAAFSATGPDSCGRVCEDALRSLEYQETLFDTLAAWRQTFLSYYRWLETGERDAWRAWRAGKREFDIAATRHLEQFGKDQQFPAFDLTSAQRAVAAFERSGMSRVLAGALLILLLAVLAVGRIDGRRHPLARIGRLVWAATVTPWHLDCEPVDLRVAAAITLPTLALIGYVIGALTGFFSPRLAFGAFVLLVVVALTFAVTGTHGPQQARGRLLLPLAGALLPGIAIVLALVTYLGPVGVWYAFWMKPTARVVLVTIFVTMCLRCAYVTVAACAVHGWRVAIGASLATGGVGLLALTVLLPDWVGVLRSLNKPLNVAPTTETMLFALRAYANVHLDLARGSWILGTVLLVCGLCVQRSRRREQTRGRPTPRDVVKPAGASR